MRWITLALLVGFVGSQHVHYEPIFSPKKTYLYHYEGVVLTGLPEDGLAKGGLKITSNVQISSIGHKNHLLKIISPQILEYSGIWPSEGFLPARKLTRMLSAQLVQPVVFEYTRGRVGNLFAPPDVPENILNIHRSILNILQISIKKNQNIYELQESGLEGVCHASYTIQEDKKIRQITVTKAKDLDNCQEKISETKGSEFSQQCDTCQQKGKNLRSVSTYTYVLKDVGGGAEISEVVSQETHQFTPFNELDGAASTESRQHLYLLECKDQTHPTPENPMEKRAGLRYQFSNELSQIPTQLVKTSDNDTKVAKVLEELVRLNQEKAHPDAPQMFLQLIQLLRSADIHGLQSIWKKNANKQSHRQWILDSIPTTATHGAVEFIQAKIEQGEFTQFEAAQAVIFVLHSIKPDCHGVDNATMLLSSPYMQRNPFLRQITLLAYGSLVQRYCATIRICPDEALQPLHELVVEAGSRGHEEETVLGLKAIGNAGQAASLKRIQKLLPGFSSGASGVSNRIHAAAVMALRNIGNKEPRKVQNIAMQLVMNNRNRAEIRMRAFIVLMETKPSLALVTTVTDSMSRDTDIHLTSFIYSYMKSLAGSSLPELQSLAAICNIAVKRLSQRCDRLSYRYSKGFHFGLFRDKFLAGIEGNLYLIKKSEGVLPTTMIANFKSYGLDITSSVLEVGIQAEGLQQALSKGGQSYGRGLRNNDTGHIVGKVSDWKPMHAIKTMASAYIKLFGQEIAFIELNQNGIQEVMKIMNNQARRDGVIKRFINQLQRGISTKWTKALLASEVRHMVPTSIGLPLELAFYYTVVSAVTAQAKVKFVPTPSNVTMFQLLNSNIEIESQFVASSVKDVIGIMGINSPLIQAGVEVQLKTSTVVPLNLTGIVNYKKRNVKIETPPLQQERQLLSIRTQSFAFSRNIEDLAAARIVPLVPSKESGVRIRMWKLAKNSTGDDQDMMGRVLPLAIPRGSVCSAEDTPDIPSPTVQRGCVKANTFGFEVCYKTSVEDNGLTTNSPLYKMVGDKSMDMAIKPVITSTPIKKLQIEFQMITGDSPFAKVNRLMKRNDTDSSETMQVEGKLALLRLKKTFHAKDKHQGGNVFQLHFQPTSISTSQNRGKLSSGSSFETSSESRKSHSKSKSLSSSSSSSSTSSSSQQSTFVGDSTSPIFSLFTRAINTDNKEKGYQAKTYVDSSMERRSLHLLVDELPGGGNWKACLNAEMPNPHRAVGAMKWGKNCLDYKITAKATTGHFKRHPAVQLKAKWDRIPQSIKDAAEMISDNLAGLAFMLGFSERHFKSPSHQLSVMAAATSQRTLDILVKTPKHIFSRQALRIPAPLPFDITSPSVQRRGLQVLADLPAMVSTAFTAECTVVQDTFSPFSENSFRYQMPENCGHVLVQDCTSDQKFLALIKRNGESLTVQLILPFSEIVMESTSMGSPQLTVNGSKVSMASLPITGLRSVSIEWNADGLKITAPELGLQTLFFDGKMIKVTQMPWMVGTTCGLCGQGKAQQSNEYQLPNRQRTKEVLRFAHSWLMSGGSCKRQ
ncbi:vitellogenin-like isoform X3 [Rhinoraja longicauda]